MKGPLKGEPSKFSTPPTNVLVNCEGAINKAPVPGDNVRLLSHPEPELNVADGVHALEAEFQSETEVPPGGLGIM